MAVTKLDEELLWGRFMYAMHNKISEEEKAEVLHQTWNELWKLMERENNFSIGLGSEDLSDLICELAMEAEMAIWNAKRYQDCIKVNEQILKIDWLEINENISHENALREIADCYEMLGNVNKARSLYETYLKEDPLWGWGWIGYFRLLHNIDVESYKKVLDLLYSKTEQLLEFRDTESLLEEMGNEFRELKENDKAKKCNDLGRRLSVKFDKAEKRIQKNIDKLLSLEITKKVGRNELCPCGSGKKYKKCCGKLGDKN